MNSRTTRIIKEARGLFWPWCVVMIVAALPAYNPLALFLGVPVLASLAFGNEFRHRTLSLLLSQPNDRTEIWVDKLGVMIVAVLSVALVFGSRLRFGSGFLGTRGHPSSEAIAGMILVTVLWFVITVSSAMFWTLYARSTMGGLGLILVQSCFFFVAFIFVMLASWKVAGVIQWFGITIWPRYQWHFVASFVFVGYAGVMLRLGWRELAQFEMTGGISGDDLLMAGPDVMPEGLAGLFRCRSTGASLNLIRKELHLLRPLWLLTLLFALGETGLRITSWLSPSDLGMRSLVSLMFTAVVVLLPVLAGSLSLGEERTSGRQSWHMTLPVPIRRQWLVKLVMAMFAGVVCAVVVVTAADQFLPGWPFRSTPAVSEMLLLLAMSLLLTFAAFWCACAVNGTVRAALWVIPVVGALGFASRFGNWLGELAAPESLTELVVSRSALVGIATSPVALVWLVVPTLLLAVIQSYRLFRMERQDSIRPVIRHLMPLAVSAFLCGFSLRVFELG